MRGRWPRTMPSSALFALATGCDRRPKTVALEHNSNTDSAWSRHLDIASSLLIVHVVKIATCMRHLVGKTAGLIDSECYSRFLTRTAR
jgi:hypothetical protein